MMFRTKCSIVVSSNRIGKKCQMQIYASYWDHIYHKCKAIKKFSPLILSALYSINFQEKFDFWGEKKLRLNLLNLNFLSTVHSALDFKPLPRFHSSLTRISIVLPSIHEKTNRFETATAPLFRNIMFMLDEMLQNFLYYFWNFKNSIF